MGIEDAVAGALISKTIEVVGKQAQDFIAAATGHKGESMGTILGDLRHKRKENAEATLGGAHFTLLNIGLTPIEVPLRVLQPAAEGASLEDEPFMRTRWTNLLANAADPRRLIGVLPSFPAVLKDLTPFDAKFLNEWSNYASSRPGDLDLYTIVCLAESAGLTGSPTILHDESASHLFYISLDTLRSLGLVAESTFSLDHEPDVGPPPVLPIKYYLTNRGRAFVRACQPPEPNA